MSWGALEGALAAGREHQALGDVMCAPAVGDPVRCPLCYSVLNWRGRSGDCPLGHYRTGT